MSTRPPRPKSAAAIPGPDPAWAAHGACRDHDPDLWFADSRTTSHAAAVRVCRRCPVAASCLGYALAHPGFQGTWAATTANQRTRLRNHTMSRPPRAA